jgi:hypothetical protein
MAIHLPQFPNGLYELHYIEQQVLPFIQYQARSQQKNSVVGGGLSTAAPFLANAQ